MARHSLFDLLVAEGWSVEFDGPLSDARTFVKQRYRFDCFSALCFQGTDRSRVSKAGPWVDRVARVTVWVADPFTEDTALSTHSRRIVMMESADGALIRKVTWSSGSTVWINPPNAELLDSIVRHGVTGKAEREQRAAEQAVRNQERNETIERHTHLLEDARDLIERIGHQREDLSMTLHGNNSRVFVDIEVLLDVLRQAAFEKEGV